MESSGALIREAAVSPGGFDPERARADFPLLQQRIGDKELVYLDNAATTQKPQCVIEAVANYYRRDNANIHRGVHQLSQRATEAHERARETIRDFIHAEDSREIVFTRGATEAINLVAHGLRSVLRPGDEILISHMEHHSNIVPWQLVCSETGARLRVVPIDDRGRLDLEAFEEMLCDRTRLVAMAHVSNALGTINPVSRIIASARGRGIPVLLDGAQAVQHLPVDVQELDCDFYVFSGHKMYAPTGIGVLYGKYRRLEQLPPYQGGGDMILTVSFEGTTYNDIPYRFEAGTPHIAGAIGLAAAIDYLRRCGLDRIARHEADLLAYATELAEATPGLRIIGTAEDKSAVLSFTLQGIHPHDIGTILDQEGVAIRTGHHCAQPVMERFQVPATARISLGLYNTIADLDRAFAAICRVQEVLG